jgi:hypothetical protein
MLLKKKKIPLKRGEGGGEYTLAPELLLILQLCFKTWKSDIDGVIILPPYYHCLSN